MLTATFGKLQFSIVTSFPWDGRAGTVVGPLPTPEIEALFRRGSVEDLVVPGRVTRARVADFSTENDPRRRGHGLLSVTFVEDEAIPVLAGKLTVEERSSFGTADRQRLPCFVFLTGHEAEGRHVLVEVPALEERGEASVARVLGDPPEIVLVDEGLKVYRHLARGGGGLVWLYTSQREPLA